MHACSVLVVLQNHHFESNFLCDRALLCQIIYSLLFFASISYRPWIMVCYNSISRELKEKKKMSRANIMYLYIVNFVWVSTTAQITIRLFIYFFASPLFCSALIQIWNATTNTLFCLANHFAFIFILSWRFVVSSLVSLNYLNWLHRFPFQIADFGLSNVFDDQRLLATFCGSPLYASPGTRNACNNYFKQTNLIR